MDLIKLCTCNNCGTVYVDDNPSNESIDYSDGLIALFKIEGLPLIPLNDGTEGCGCPRCESDAYLQDNVNEQVGGMAQEIHVYLYE